MKVRILGELTRKSVGIRSKQSLRLAGKGRQTLSRGVGHGAPVADDFDGTSNASAACLLRDRRNPCAV
jgi:hypothetical protein